MAKGIRGRRRIASRQFGATPYPVSPCRRDVSDCSSEKKCTNGTEHMKDWEDATCSVCMEYPHNAVLLLCSSYDKGCRAYMCGTSARYSNCLDQYKKAYTKVTSHGQNQSSHGATEDSNSFVSPPVSSGLVVNHGEVTELVCPLCRGQVKGWTIVEVAREYLNCKKRSCMEDKCSYVGSYKELRKHVKLEHPSARPRIVDPAREQKWRRLEREREREDVISTVTSLVPGSVVFGDYVIERTPNGFDSSDDDEEDGLTRVGRSMEDFDVNLVNVFLLFQALGRTGGNVGSFEGLRRQGQEVQEDDDVNSDDHGNNHHGTSFMDRLRRQGRAILNRSGRRLRRREASGGNT